MDVMAANARARTEGRRLIARCANRGRYYAANHPRLPLGWGAEFPEITKPELSGTPHWQYWLDEPVRAAHPAMQH